MIVQLLFVAVLIGASVGQVDVRCPVPVSPSNGQRFLHETGQKVTYICDPGYTLSGESVSFCIHDQWSSTPPACVAEEDTNSSVSEYPSSESKPKEQNRYRFTGCQENYYYSETSRSCKHCPSNSETNGTGKISIDDCICSEGYQRDETNPDACQDINECEIGFNCSHECVNTHGGAYCSCPKGYQLDSDTKTCIDTDECVIKNGGCHMFCLNTEGSFECTCAEGYRKLDFFTCSDIDECSGNKHGCMHECINFPGGYYCICRKGYRVGNDQRSCQTITCPRISEPPNTENVTYYGTGGKIMKPTRQSYPVKTKATFTCRKGHKLSLTRLTPATVKCIENGKWEGSIPQCIALKCPPLKHIENGNIHPNACRSRPVDTSKRCFVTCNKGYQRIGRRAFTCSSTQRWFPETIPECRRMLIRPYIQCPEDIVHVLPPSQKSTPVIIASPKTNVDVVSRLKIQPTWVQLDTETSFPAGVTVVNFTAFGPKNRTVECSVTVNIIDKEPPVALNCPRNLMIKSNHSLGEVVTWTEPAFVDNVGVDSVLRSEIQGTVLPAGMHTVTYTAVDNAGNVGQCNFTVTISSPDCGYPNTPVHGRLECHDWTLGRMCQPYCDHGYILFPQEPSIFTCDDTGTWAPSNLVQNCTRYFPLVVGDCPQDYELQENSETGERICVACPENWTLCISGMCNPEGTKCPDTIMKFEVV